ncbi:MAG: SRPBCC family protein [Intrasporangium sp.]|uniref:SRPBCC family protein n=1 Tax=Intrasporangium sp. TaxID=1925024 RepID=UPI00264A2E84|nr:SRPBCC family protein [Intrasporangium sp.]MDN5796795.1 SRPBCC family protein [Intrasporangium sp.]
MIFVERTTALTADVLWEVLSDLRRWPDWLPTVDAARPVDPDHTAGPGACYVIDQPGLPRATWTVTDWRAGAGFTWESRRPGILTTGTHELVPIDDGTTIRLGVTWSGLLAAPVGWVYGSRTRDYVTREAAALEATAAARRTEV